MYRVVSIVSLAIAIVSFWAVYHFDVSLYQRTIVFLTGMFSLVSSYSLLKKQEERKKRKFEED